MPLPTVPVEANLSYGGEWSRENAKRLEVVDAALPENDELLGLLQENLRLAEYNHAGLEVFIALAHLFRQNLVMLYGLSRIDAVLTAAQTAAKEGKDKDAVAAVDQALEIARHIRSERNHALHEATATWYKTWYPRVDEANGRHFLHELDDVKDHLPDRTVDMSYLVYDELLLPLEDWYSRTQSARNHYAQAHQIPLRDERLDWNSLER